MNKKILILGGTGAMGVYVIPALLEHGYQLDVVTLDDVQSGNLALRYIKADGLNIPFMRELLKTHYDGIIDFLMYGTTAFRERHEMLLSNTDHYIHMSSYRVYAGEYPITEESPRLLDVSRDERYLKTEDYSLYKAREEDIILHSGYTNYTILRPSIVYSKRRFQLVTLEAPLTVERALRGKAVVLPRAATDIQGTMTWAGDVAKILVRLLFNPKAYGEIFTVATAEHRSWETIAGYYQELIGMKIIYASTESYIRILKGHYNDDVSKYVEWQLNFDRLFHRIIDNQKLLRVTGMRQTDFMPLYEGLKRELSALPRDTTWGGRGSDADRRMDAYIAQRMQSAKEQ